MCVRTKARVSIYILVHICYITFCGSAKYIQVNKFVPRHYIPTVQECKPFKINIKIPLPLNFQMILTIDY